MTAKHHLIARVIVGALATVATASCSDKVVPLSRSRSPDGAFVADYSKILYGGAAGGVTYCANILDADGRLLEDCALAMIHEPAVSLEWSADRLRVCVDGGRVTHHTKSPITDTKRRTLHVTYQVASAGRCEAQLRL